ncbi:hypothetical protein HHI36_003772 [Cryptolaemus montrouzieri]|uniref:Uncharacterized protein n=1 Tax=Cryptolaemus montrouzieri TaxID=559131 RepID=A0ABD2NPJ8_9CUCU
MADGDSRSVAEKLAAAKKKHRAYLKEKGIKTSTNANKNFDAQSGRIPNEPINKISTFNPEFTGKSEVSTNIPDETKIIPQIDPLNSNTYEADLPLPQYSMDYNGQSQHSSLPDPLSFFDNFSNVGATFQNFAPAITSFFNNAPSQSSHNTVDLPNQIVVQENTSKGFLSVSDVGVNDSIKNSETTPEMFSYDRFKNDAINSAFKSSSKDADTKDNVESKEFENQIFDQFTNSNEENNFPNQTSSIYNQNIPISLQSDTRDIQVNVQDELSNELKIKPNIYSNIQENVPLVSFEFEENLEGMNVEKQILKILGKEQMLKLKNLIPIFMV